MSKTAEELQEYLGQFPSIMRGKGRFDSKLTFDERCAVLALYLSGIHRRVLSSAYGIDRRTVAHVYNAKSVHYKNVRAELEKLGRDAFLKRYLTEEAVQKAASVANNPEVTLTDNAWLKKQGESGQPNKRKNRNEGVHVVHPDQCEYSHRVTIAWREEEPDEQTGNMLPAGWWYRDEDGNYPDKWFYTNKESLISSTNALRAAEEEIMDKW